MADYGTSNKSAGAGGHSSPPLHRDFVSVSNMEDDFENVRVGSGKPCLPAMTDYGTSNKSAGAGGHSGPPLRRYFVSVTNMSDDFENVRVQAERRVGPR